LSGAVVGATLGALSGYLLLTAGGRRACGNLECVAEDVMSGIARLSGVVGRLGHIASLGMREWQTLTQLRGDFSASPRP
jgi:hypothetical protein